MKIVYMTYGIHYSGGMERVLSVKANYLADVLGHEVYIVITDGKGRIPFFKFSDKIRIIDLGINYRDLSQVNRLKKVIPYLKKIITHRKKLSQLLYEIKADICISMFQYEAVILHGITDGSKKIIESHFCRIVDLLRNKNNRGISKIIGNYLYRRNSKIADKYDCLVTLTYDDLLRYPDVKSNTCIHNPLTTSQLPPRIHTFTHDASAITISSEDNKRVVLAVGRVSYQKGFDNLVEIWNTLEKSYRTGNCIYMVLKRTQSFSQRYQIA